MKFYVATRYADGNRARNVATALEDLGHEITHKWFDIEETKDLNVFHQYAVADYKGARFADIVLLLADVDNLYGALIEAGIALGADKEVWVVAPRRSELFFWSLPMVTIFHNVSDVLSRLRGDF